MTDQTAATADTGRGLPLFAMRVKQALNRTYRPRPAPSKFGKEDKLKVYDLAAQVIGDCPLTYLEFGVHRGWSIKQIAQRFPDPGARFIGFDSFEGLPERWSGLPPGHFSTGGTPPPTNDPRVSFVKGWFQDTLPGFAAERRFTGPTLINFDADLYSSTLFLLTTLWYHIPEYYFLFDEFAQGEVVALYDFSLAYPVDFQFLACTLPKPGRPELIFGHLKNSKFRLPPPSPAKANVRTMAQRRAPAGNPSST
jgi:hypothetical protein